VQSWRHEISLGFSRSRPAAAGPLITGKTLPDAGPNDNAQAWVGAIPRDGKYLITVGAGASGPAAPTPYSLTVSLQPDCVSAVTCGKKGDCGLAAINS
jgi:hypothetical protein